MATVGIFTGIDTVIWAWQAGESSGADVMHFDDDGRIVRHYVTSCSGWRLHARCASETFGHPSTHERPLNSRAERQIQRVGDRLIWRRACRLIAGLGGFLDRPARR
jgi:hypothetical protein